MLNTKTQFEISTTELINSYLNNTNEFDESINKYIHSKEFLKFSIDSVIKSMNILLNEHADFLVLSFVIPEKKVIDVVEIYSSYNVDVENIENLKSALNNHLEYIEAENFDIILHHYLIYNDKRDNRIFLQPSCSAKYYPIPYYKNVA